MTKSRKVCSLLAAIAASWAPAIAQDQRPLALTNARILTMSDAGVIERGTILVRDGRIEAVGADAKTPLGPRVIDVQGGRRGATSRPKWRQSSGRACRRWSLCEAGHLR